MIAKAINKIVTPMVMPTIIPVELDPSDPLLVTGDSVITGVDVTTTGPGVSAFKLCHYNIIYVLYVISFTVTYLLTS